MDLGPNAHEETKRDGTIGRRPQQEPCPTGISDCLIIAHSPTSTAREIVKQGGEGLRWQPLNRLPSLDPNTAAHGLKQNLLVEHRRPSLE